LLPSGSTPDSSRYGGGISLIFADHKVEAFAPCDEIFCQVETRQILQSYWCRLQQRDCGCHLSQNRVRPKIPLLCFDFSTDALGQAGRQAKLDELESAKARRQSEI
jgi:hypothetical protein